MSVQAFFKTISQINKYNDLEVFKDRWGRIIKQKWFDKFSEEDQEELIKVKNEKKIQLIDQDRERKETRSAEVYEYLLTEKGAIIKEEIKAFLAYGDVKVKIALAKTPEPRDLERLKNAKKYFRLKGIEIEDI